MENNENSPKAKGYNLDFGLKIIIIINFIIKVSISL